MQVCTAKIRATRHLHSVIVPVTYEICNNSEIKLQQNCKLKTKFQKEFMPQVVQMQVCTAGARAAGHLHSVGVPTLPRPLAHAPWAEEEQRRWEQGVGCHLPAGPQ